MILFLDYDGVLHPDQFSMGAGNRRAPNAYVFEWAGLLADALRPYPDVKIVLSTSWARIYGYGGARDFLLAALYDRCVGATWHSGMKQMAGLWDQGQTWYDRATRYEQIKRYVRVAGITNWVAIDDDPEGWDAVDDTHLVKTDGAVGISDPAALLDLDRKLSERPWSQPAPEPAPAP